MKILLTGSSGFFSKELIKNISLNKKNKLFCLTRKKKYIKNIKFWCLDLSKKKLNTMPKKLNFDIIIHSAFVRHKKNLNYKTLELNYNITKNLISIIKANRFKKFINLSSASLYPNKDGKYSETSELNFFQNSDKIYGISKYFSELMFNLHLNKKKILHLRIGNIIGNDTDNSIVSQMKKDLKKKNIIEIYGNGQRVLNLIHIQKLIKYIFLITRNNTQGIFNLCDYSINTKQIAKFIKIKYGQKNSKIKVNNSHKKNPKFYLNTNKFFNLVKIQRPNNKELLNEI